MQIKFEFEKILCEVHKYLKKIFLYTHYFVLYFTTSFPVVVSLLLLGCCDTFLEIVKFFADDL